MDKQTKKPEKKKDEPKEFQIIAHPDIRKGVYSNVALIRHTENEFLVDFLLHFRSETQLVSRVILSPNHMRALRKAIDNNLKKYEESYSKNNKDKKN